MMNPFDVPTRKICIVTLTHARKAVTRNQGDGEIYSKKRGKMHSVKTE